MQKLSLHTDLTTEGSSSAPLPLTQEESFDFRRLLYKFQANWFYFLVALVLSVASVYIYIRYALPVYRTDATILLREEEQDKRLLESLLEDLDGYSKSKQNLENEIAILGSSALVRETIDSCRFHTSMFSEGNVRSTELYKLSPVQVDARGYSEELAGRPIYIEMNGEKSFRLYRKGSPDKGYDPSEGTFKIDGKGPWLTYGNRYRVGPASLVFTYHPENSERVDENRQELYLVFNDLDQLTDHIQKKLEIAQSTEKGTLVSLASSGPVPDKEADFINTLVKNYIRRGLEEKNTMAEATISFIDEQVSSIAASLQDAEQELKSFRARNKVMDLGTASKFTFEKLDALEGEKANLLVRRQYYLYLQEYVRSNKQLNQIVAPSSIGIEDPLLNSLIERLSQLASEKSTLALSADQRNPALKAVNDRIQVAKGELEENVRNIIKNSDITLSEINKRIASAEGEIVKLPETERRLVNLQRRFNLNDNIYTYLMQKRAEAGMARAANMTDTRIIEPAQSRKAVMIAPRRTTYYALALTMGLFLPALLLFIGEFVNDKIRARDELERLTPIPVVGTVGHSKGQGNLVVDKNLKSVITEAFRTIRLNLNYFADDRQPKMVGITSSVSGEGKTFTSINLAAINALAGKKTLLLMADMRKPKYELDLGISHERGLSSFLSRQAGVKDIIQKTRLEHLYAISSGPVPPNPAELLGSETMDRLLESVKDDYDCIIVDTPPLGLVSDFFQLSERMDINIYIVRHNYTRQGFLTKVNEYYRQKKIRNLCLVVNDVTFSGGAYGYGYGYDYGYGYGEGYFSDPSKGGSIGGWFKDLFRKG